MSELSLGHEGHEHFLVLVILGFVSLNQTTLMSRPSVKVFQIETITHFIQ